jgi:hypothetical protein
MQAAIRCFLIFLREPIENVHKAEALTRQVEIDEIALGTRLAVALTFMQAMSRRCANRTSRYDAAGKSTGYG